MLHSNVILWLILTAAFLIIEVGTVALVSLWFVAGAAVGLAAALIGLPFWVQVVAFLAVSAAMVVVLRPLLMKRREITKTNLDSIIGSEGLVTSAIDNLAGTGEVRLGAMTWTARSTGGKPICEGAHIRVDKIEGVKVFVTEVSA